MAKISDDADATQKAKLHPQYSFAMECGDVTGATSICFYVYDTDAHRHIQKPLMGMNGIGPLMQTSCNKTVTPAYI